MQRQRTEWNLLKRTPANAWNVPEKAGYRENINKDKMYRYTVVAYGNRVQEWINDDLLIDIRLRNILSKRKNWFSKCRKFNEGGQY